MQRRKVAQAVAGISADQNNIRMAESAPFILGLVW